MGYNTRQASIRLLKAISALPVEEWVETDNDEEPELMGYVMQARHEWDEVKAAQAELKEALEVDRYE